LLKALYRNAELLILDEPTAVLSPQEVQELFAILRRMKEQGKTIIIITHKLEEVLAISDEVTVMRDGKAVGNVKDFGNDDQRSGPNDSRPRRSPASRKDRRQTGQHRSKCRGTSM
jgi:ABC-type uncharacterized transport system ATPase subunit